MPETRLWHGGLPNEAKARKSAAVLPTLDRYCESQVWGISGSKPSRSDRRMRSQHSPRKTSSKVCRSRIAKIAVLNTFCLAALCYSFKQSPLQVSVKSKVCQEILHPL